MNNINFNFNPNNNMPGFINQGIHNARTPAPVDMMPTPQPAVSPQMAENLLMNSAKSLYDFFANAQSVRMTGSDMSLVLKDMLGMQKDIKEFLNPYDIKLSNPNVFSDMQKVVERISKVQRYESLT